MNEHTGAADSSEKNLKVIEQYTAQELQQHINTYVSRLERSIARCGELYHHLLHDEQVEKKAKWADHREYNFVYLLSANEREQQVEILASVHRMHPEELLRIFIPVQERTESGLYHVLQQIETRIPHLKKYLHREQRSSPIVQARGVLNPFERDPQATKYRTVTLEELTRHSLNLARNDEPTTKSYLQMLRSLRPVLDEVYFERIKKVEENAAKDRENIKLLLDQNRE